MMVLLTEDEYKALKIAPREEAEKQLREAKARFSKEITSQFSHGRSIPCFASQTDSLRWLANFLASALEAANFPPLALCPK